MLHFAFPQAASSTSTSVNDFKCILVLSVFTMQLLATAYHSGEADKLLPILRWISLCMNSKCWGTMVLLLTFISNVLFPLRAFLLAVAVHGQPWI